VYAILKMIRSVAAFINLLISMHFGAFQWDSEGRILLISYYQTQQHHSVLAKPIKPFNS
jgi:hypothetical protein